MSQDVTSPIIQPDGQQPDDHDHRALIGGPYVAPLVNIGDWLHCAMGGECQVIGWSEGPIPWPLRKSSGIYGKTHILCGDLETAVRLESNRAIAHWWGVIPDTVSNWRRALKIGRKTPGTRQLHTLIGHQSFTPEVWAQGQALAGTPDALAKLSASQSTRYARRAAWKPEEEAILGTVPDAQAAARLGRSYQQVRKRREALGIPIYQRGPGERRALYTSAIPCVTLNPKAMRDRRKALGHLQREVAARAGLHPGTYTALESGQRRGVQRQTLAKIASALECAPETLLDLHND